MDILLTNDDGIYAPGIWALYHRLAARHAVTVIAPDRERSAVGHGITLHEPLRATRIVLNGGPGGYAVNGTPADCVKLGVLEILKAKPDMVLAGINRGANVGVNLNYSGTVAAAKEAALSGMLAIAVSIEGYETDHYDEAAFFIAQLAEKVFEKGLPLGTFLNVNIPNMPIKASAGVRVSRQGLNLFEEYIEKRVDLRNRPYYWQGRDSQLFERNLDIDGAALTEKYISITPVKCDMTDYRLIEELKHWGLDEAVKG
ncbi:MAG: 5'/3'-nucleotidase SurE [Desulfobacterales bacterium]|nr:MAG: 5'/3'-nucleotidase SurE [Desulfobacterales bacterium]